MIRLIAAAVAVLLCAAGQSARAQDYYFGGTGGETCIPFGCQPEANPVILFQQVYEGASAQHYVGFEYFFEVPATPTKASFIHWIEPLPVTGHFFYTDKHPGELSTNPADNILEPVNTRDGVAFYHPELGNLLIQIVIPMRSIKAPILYDERDPSAQMLYVLSGETTGILRSGGLYTYFATIPEPASWAVMTLGFGLAGSALRRHRRAARPS